MLSLSQTTGYAVLALSCLNGPDGAPVLISDIAECTGIPKPYLHKLMHSLNLKGVIITKRGYRGGVVLARPAEGLSLLEIAEAVDSRDWFSRCLLGLEECSDARACPVHEFWKEKRATIERQLRKVSVADVAAFERERGTRLKGCCTNEPMIRKRSRTKVAKRVSGKRKAKA